MKTIALLAVLAAVAILAAYFVFTKPSSVSEQDAKKFFLEDLESKYPSADVREIMEILPSTASDGSPYFQLKARVTNGMATPCPERMHVFYDYPPKNFVAQPPEYITRGCRVCLDVEKCIIAFPEEAIIASHTYNGTDDVAEFIKANADAKAEASFIGGYQGQSDVWKVSWSSDYAKSGYEVLLSKQQNSVISVRKIAP
jgi:hypothetical protein